MWPFRKNHGSNTPKCSQDKEVAKALSLAKDEHAKAVALYSMATEEVKNALSRLAQDYVELACDTQMKLDAVIDLLGLEVAVNGPEEVEIKIVDETKYRLALGESESETKVQLVVDVRRKQALLDESRRALSAFERGNR